MLVVGLAYGGGIVAKFMCETHFWKGQEAMRGGCCGGSKLAGGSSV